MPETASLPPPAETGAPSESAPAANGHRRAAWLPADARVTPDGRPVAPRPPVRRGLWAARGLWLGVLAWVVALAGTLILAVDPAFGALVVVLGALLGLLAWAGQLPIAAFPAPVAGPLLRLGVTRVFRLAAIALAGVTLWRADTESLAAPYGGFGLAGWLWLLGMALLVAATLAWPRRPVGDGPNPPAPFPYWEGGDAAASSPPAPFLVRAFKARFGKVGEQAPSPQGREGRVRGESPITSPAAHGDNPPSPYPLSPGERDVARSSADKPTPKNPHPEKGDKHASPAQVEVRFTRGEGLVLFGLVVLALVLRVWDLQDVPFAVHGDEFLTGRNAVQDFLQPGVATPVFGTVWPGIELPALWFVLVAASLKLGGGTLAALRLPAALFGAATVLPFYGLVRGAWGRTAAIAGTFILAVSAADIQYSRVTLNNIVAPFFWAVCFFFLLRGLRRKRPVDWALAGLAGGLGEYSYYGTRLLPFILVAFFAYLLIVHWRQGWQYLGHFGLLALGYVAGFGPLMAYYTQHPQLYFGRGAGVLTWDHFPRDWADLQAMWQTLWPLLAENLLGFSTHADQSSVYWAPLLLPAEGALLALGAALLIWRWRHPPAFLMLLAGGGVLFVGGTLVHGVPFLAHWTPAFPAYYAMVAVPIGAVAAWAARRAPVAGRSNRRPAFRLPQSVLRLRRYALPASLALGLAVLAWVNLDFYFFQYQVPRPEFELPATQDRWFATLGTDYVVRVLGPTWQPYDAESVSYFLKGQDGATLNNPAAELPVPGVAGKGLAFLIPPDAEAFQTKVLLLYPGGAKGELTAHQGTHLFTTYVLTPTAALAAYGAQLNVQGAAGNGYQWSGQVDQIGDLPPGASGPLHAQWLAGFYVPLSGAYQLAVTGGAAQVLVNDQPATATTPVTLQPGWQRLVVTADLAGPQPLHLTAGLVGTPGVEVPQTMLWPAPPERGG